MSENTEKPDATVQVTANSVEEIASAIGTEMNGSESAATADGEAPAELSELIETFEDVLQGLEKAAQSDERGRARKKIMQYAGREDMPNHVFGDHLDLLEFYGLAERDDKRWKPAKTE